MFVLASALYDLTPDAGSYTKSITHTLDSSRYYKVVTGSGETDVFPGSVSGNIPVRLNDHAQGGSSVAVSVSSGTLTIVAAYPGIGPAQVIEYAEVVQSSTSVRTYLTNWPTTYDIGNWPDTYDVGNWPTSYTVTGTVSLSETTISNLASAISTAISG